MTEDRMEVDVILGVCVCVTSPSVFQLDLDILLKSSMSGTGSKIKRGRERLRAVPSAARACWDRCAGSVRDSGR